MSAMSLSENQRGELLLTEQAHQLTAGGGKPWQGYQAVVQWRLTEDQKREAAALYETGLSCAEVAQRFGVTRQSMWDVLRRRTVMRPKPTGQANHFWRGGTRARDSAQNTLEKAIQRGEIERRTTCEACGTSGTFKDGRTAIQAHHPDYSKPLEVIWLCQPCHHEWHRENTAEGVMPSEASRELICSAEASHSHAKTSASPGNEPASQESDPASSSSSPESPRQSDLGGSSSRTSPVSTRLAGVRDADAAGRFYAGISVEAARELASAMRSISSGASRRWTEARALAAEQHEASSIVTPGLTSLWYAQSCENSGTESPSGFLTQSTSECRSDGAGCSSSAVSLTEILEPPLSVPARYSLSARAATGILRRAEKRGRALPTHLLSALSKVAASAATESEPTKQQEVS